MATTGTTAADEKRIENPTTMEEWTPRGRFPFLRYLLIACGIAVLVGTALLFVISVEDYVHATGLIYPAEYAEVHSVVEGVVEKVHVDPGDRVKAGQVIATLDHFALTDRIERLKLQQKQLEARTHAEQTSLDLLRLNPLPTEFRNTDTAVAEARAELDLAEKRLARSKRLEEKQLESTAKLEGLETEQDRAKAKLAAAQRNHQIVQKGLAKAILAEAESRLAELRQQISSLEAEEKLAQQELDRYILKAPKDGVAVMLPKDDGDSVERGELIATIAIGSERCLYLRVSEDQFREVAEGQSARFYSAMFPYREYGYATGRVIGIRPWARQGPTGRYYEIKASVTEAPFELKLGSSVAAEIVLGHKLLYEFLTD